MDIVGGVRVVDGSEAKIVSGIDDHSRFVVSARVVARATARPVCDALAFAMRAHGVPEQILTDNGKVFTARFGPGPGPVLFDRICTDNGIRHFLTAPRSPTTTGKVERWHKTLHREFLDGKVFDSIDDAQAQLDAWVWHYNHERPHQSIGRVPPIERFQLAEPREKPAKPLPETSTTSGPVTTRRVSAKGTIGFNTVTYKAGAWLAGQTVEVVCERGLVQIHHRGVLVATHARRHPIDKQTAGVQRGRKPRPSRSSSSSVTRKVDTSGNVCFAGANYQVGSAYRRRQVQVAVVVTPSRSPSVSSSSEATRPSTTAPASTAPPPTPADAPTAPTPHEGSICQAGTGVESSAGYRGLTGPQSEPSESVNLPPVATDPHCSIPDDAAAAYEAEAFDVEEDPPDPDPLVRPEVIVRTLGVPSVDGHPTLGRLELNLVTFLACCGGSATESQVIDAVWNGRAIERGTLWNRISKARAALGGFIPPRDQDPAWYVSLRT